MKIFVRCSYRGVSLNKIPSIKMQMVEEQKVLLLEWRWSNLAVFVSCPCPFWGGGFCFVAYPFSASSISSMFDVREAIQNRPSHMSSLPFCVVWLMKHVVGRRFQSVSWNRCSGALGFRPLALCCLLLLTCCQEAGEIRLIFCVGEWGAKRRGIGLRSWTLFIPMLFFSDSSKSPSCTGRFSG